MKNLLFILLPGILLLSSCSNEFNGKDGLKTVYFPNTEIVQVVAEYKDGKREGELKEYYRNGKLKLRQFYRDDQQDDSTFFYHENGNIKEIQYRKDFKKEGLWKKFNKEGKLYEEINLKNDYLDGCSTTYTYRTGRLLQRFNYKSGMKDGKQEVYYNNGNPKYVTFFRYGKPCKGTEEWEEGGQKIDNEIKISVREKNKLLLNGKLTYYIKVADPKADDEVYLMADKTDDNYATTVSALAKEGDEYVLEYTVPVGGFIMETAKVGVFRKTGMGNTVIETKNITVSGSNF